MAYMETQSASDDKARFFRKSLTEFKFVGTLSMMMDVMPILTFMSLALQKEHVELLSVQALMSSMNSQINDLKVKNGKFLFEVLPAEGA